MKLQLISDLHTEFWDNPGKLYARIQIEPDLDFLVIAGDLVVPSRQPGAHVKEAFEHYAKLARHIIYVDGNHEYYGGSFESVETTLRAIMPSNFHWLSNHDETIDGVHFFGGTMWFANVDGLNHYYKQYMNDFKLIEDLESVAYDRNQIFSALGELVIRPETIVVTHHLPHMNSVPERFKREPTNRFFVSDQTGLIGRRQPRLWMHGHTHEPCDYKLGETRVLCNPYGYPSDLYKDWGSSELKTYPVVVVEV
jgi:predicted phosphodiesterase